MVTYANGRKPHRRKLDRLEDEFRVLAANGSSGTAALLTVPELPIVAQRQWIEGSDESNLGWYDYEDVDLTIPLHKGYEALTNHADASAALSHAQTVAMTLRLNLGKAEARIRELETAQKRSGITETQATESPNPAFEVEEGA